MTQSSLVPGNPGRLNGQKISNLCRHNFRALATRPDPSAPYHPLRSNDWWKQRCYISINATRPDSSEEGVTESEAEAIRRQATTRKRRPYLIFVINARNPSLFK